ncbi:MAG: hypothetical protein ACLGHQ_04900 [Acidimicrobiia bacterium]
MDAMIVDPSQTVVLSCLGWVDHGSLWKYDVTAGVPTLLPLSDAEFLRVFAGDERYFVVQHHWGASRFRVTAHAWDHPEVSVGAIDVSGWVPNVSGDRSVWAGLPTAFVGALDHDATGAAGHYVLTTNGGSPTVTRLEWFDERYDHGYQGVISVLRLRRDAMLLFGVQRSSDLVLTDVAGGSELRRVPLAGAFGNPHPFQSRLGHDIWTTDYDTIVRLDSRSWAVLGERMLQPAAAGTRMFVGDVWLPPDESMVVVARPGVGDVLVLDPRSLDVSASVELGREPLAAVALTGGTVIARDWKTGDPLLGELPSRRRWARRRG